MSVEVDGGPGADAAAATSEAGGPPPRAEAAVGGDRPPRRRLRRLRWAPLVVLGVAALLAAGAGLSGWAGSPPGEDSVDAGFARDMSTHHAQAVTMGMVEFERGRDPDLRAIGRDVALSQQREIGIMSAWLTSWGLARVGRSEPMSWMRPDASAGHAGHAAGADSGGAGGGGSGLMPGMATEAELTRLGAATGRELDVAFLTLMIRHHRGGIAMAQEAALRAEESDVAALARAMVIAQAQEIETMQELLRGLGAPPA
jgi:uncharacterized protein (DUF305 family)